MNIKVLAVGKVRESYIKLGISEFSKRLSGYCNLIIIEVADERAPENLSMKEEEQVKEAEGQRILKQLDESSYVIALDIKGKQLSSEDTAELLEKLSISGTSNVTFIIGGSLGLSKEVLSKAHFILSFSKMTFPHQLMRLFLLEQVYRSFRIIKNQPYHK